MAEAWRVERGYLAALPDPLPATDRHAAVRVSKDCFVRFAGVDYSVPPGHVGRRVRLVASLTELRVFADGGELARHTRSDVPADVVLAPAHARALMRERAARQRLATNDVALPGVDLARYDAAVGVRR